MKWLIVVLALLAFPIVAADAEPWGCCVPEFGECFDGTTFESQSTFVDACTESPGTIEGSGQLTTCNTYATSGGVCEVGCCCAGADVFDSPSINSDEEMLRITRNACNSKQSFSFNSLPSGGSCVDVCGSEVQPPNEGGDWTISGVVRNASDSTPLQGVAVFIPIQQGDISVATDANGEFTLSEVPEQTARVFAIHPMCRPGQSSPIKVDRDVSGITINLDCSITTCPHDSPSIESVDLVQGSSEVSITAKIEDTCRDFVQFEARRCDENFAHCTSLQPSTSPSLTDSGLEAHQTYCYKLFARFSDGSTTESTESAQACITSGSDVCMSRAPEDPNPWCGRDSQTQGSAILSCDDENNVDVSLCEGNTFCSTRSGQPECVEAPECTLCNGLLGLFPDPLREVIAGPFTEACGQTPLCYEDSALARKPVMVDAYDSCLATAQCSEYRSQSACQQDTCSVSAAGCEWKWINQEIGSGICNPLAGEPACEQCDDILGYCSKDACEAISDQCYYDQEHNGLSAKGCLPKSKMACRYYDTKEDCIGGGEDAQYNIGEDNERLQSSQDKLGFGACTWIESKNRCIKDADMERTQDEDDCIESGYFFANEQCVTDSEPPKTQLFLSDVPIYSRLDIRSLPFAVHDDSSPAQEVKTFVCFTTQGTRCYPEKTLGQVSLPEESSYTMYFYSVDASENHEVVQSADIIVKDTGEPGIEEIRIEER